MRDWPIRTCVYVKYIFKLLFQNDNKRRVLRSLIVHDAIAKPKMVLDQLREGLRTLGFGERMEKYPDTFKELFVAGEKILTADDIKGQLQFPSELTPEEENIKKYMLQFINDASVEDLKSFLAFATGSPTLALFGLGTIKIEFSDRESIFSSTCTFCVTIPNSFPDQATMEKLSLAFRIVIFIEEKGYYSDTHNQNKNFLKVYIM